MDSREPLRQTLQGFASVRTGEVATLFRVCPTTVRRLADRGFLPHWRSPGGQRRFSRALVEQVALEADGQKRYRWRRPDDRPLVGLRLLPRRPVRAHDPQPGGVPMTGHTLLAFRWMAGQAHRWQRKSDAAADREHRERFALVASAYSHSAERLKMFAEMPLDHVCAKLARTTGPNGLAKIVGKWPGNETDEEIREALAALDPEEASP